MIGDILQPSHLLFILVIALIVLGPKKLPEVGRSLGKGMRDFRSALSGADPREDIAALNEQTVPPVQAPEPVATPVPEPVAAPVQKPAAAEPVTTQAEQPVPEPVESD